MAVFFLLPPELVGVAAADSCVVEEWLWYLLKLTFLFEFV